MIWNGAGSRGVSDICGIFIDKQTLDLTTRLIPSNSQILRRVSSRILLSLDPVNGPVRIAELRSSSNPGEKSGELGLNLNQLIRASKNFCFNDLRKRGTETRYFSMKCAPASNNYIFLGFPDGI